MHRSCIFLFCFCVWTFSSIAQENNLPKNAMRLGFSYGYGINTKENVQVITTRGEVHTLRSVEDAFHFWMLDMAIPLTHSLYVYSSLASVKINTRSLAICDICDALFVKRDLNVIQVPVGFQYSLPIKSLDRRDVFVRLGTINQFILNSEEERLYNFGFQLGAGVQFPVVEELQCTVGVSYNKMLSPVYKRDQLRLKYQQMSLGFQYAFH